MSRARSLPFLRSAAGLLAAGVLVGGVLASCLLTGCGKKGPPSAPIRILPAPAQGVKARQIGPAVEITAALSLFRTDGSPLASGAEVRVLRLPTTETLRPELVSPRYLLRQFEKGAKVVARFSGDALRSAARGGRLRVRDTEAVAGGKPGAHPRFLYGVLVVDADGERSPLHAPVSIEVLEPPPSPVDLKAVVAEGEVRLAWGPAAPETSDNQAATAAMAPPEPSPAPAMSVGPEPSTAPPVTSTAPEPPAATGASGPPGGLHRKEFLYNVYRKGAQEEADPETPLNPKPIPSTSYVDTTFRYGEDYVYFVRFLAAAGLPFRESVDSNFAEVRPLDRFPPAAPTGLAATAEGNVIKVYWFPSSEPDLGGYRIYRRAGPDAPPQPLGDVGPTETSFVDSTARAGVRYHYSVAAFDQASPRNESIRSDERSEMLAPEPGQPAAAGEPPRKTKSPSPEKPR